uniref:Uncharacterized protein n=1 Tax=Mycena chlorophos TaxID=658473 RepID=A0ABQ0LG56_MYCCL|nr:predicted protein [Mycena chlorophos]
MGKRTQDITAAVPKADALANTAALCRDALAANRKEVVAQLEKMFEERDELVDKIYNSQVGEERVSKEWIWQQVTSSAYSTRSREPSYYNAYVAEVLDELKADNPRAFLKAHVLRLTPGVGADIHAAKREITRRWKAAGCKGLADYLTDEEKHRLRDTLADRNQERHVSVRKTNIGNSVDVSRNFAQVEYKMQGVYERANAPSLCFVSKGRLSDKIEAQCLSTGDCQNFLLEIFNVSPVEFLWRFEAYNCMKERGRDLHAIGKELTNSNKGQKTVQTVDALRQLITRMVHDGLMLITNIAQVKMYYWHYDYGIRYLLGVELVGLLEGDTKPVNPALITTAGRLQETVTALQSGKMHWQKVSRTAMKKLKAELGEEGSKRLRLPKKSKKMKQPELSEDEDEEVPAKQGSGKKKSLSRAKEAEKKATVKAAASKASKAKVAKGRGQKKGKAKEQEQEQQEGEMKAPKTKARPKPVPTFKIKLPALVPAPPAGVETTNKRKRDEDEDDRPKKK